MQITFIYLRPQKISTPIITITRTTPEPAPTPTVRLTEPVEDTKMITYIINVRRNDMVGAATIAEW